MAKEGRRLAAIMFTDIVGYTALSQKNESVGIQLLEKHRKLIRPVLSKYGGVEVKTIGDAFLIEFGSALEATECGVEMQKVLHEYNENGTEKVLVRIGIHVGDVIHREGDVLGDAVNIASRIEPLAVGGEICISEQVYAQVRNKIPFRMLKLQPQELKNVSFHIDVYKLELPWEEKHMQTTNTEARNRLAVLPFTNMSPDPQDEFFADGLTEEMITELSKIPSLRVIARTSSMHYKNLTKGVREIGQELRVGSILEGSIRKAGNKIRVTTQLIDANSEEHLWADKYDKELNDIFAVQSEIAANVAGALELKLVPQSSSANLTPENIEAYTLYLRARFLWNKRSAMSIRDALKFFEAALIKDPGYARAYSGIADCYSILIDRNEMTWAEGGPRARAACEKALELNDSLPEAHASLGLSLTREFDYEGAEKEFRRAIHLNPGYAPAYQWYCIMLECIGRMDEAGITIGKAEEADPLSPIILHNSGYYEWVCGRDDAALEKWNRGLEVNPGFDVLHFDKAAYFAKKSRREEALAELKLLDTASNENRQRTALSAFLYGFIGEREESERRLRGLLSEANDPSAPAAQVAWAYAGLGDVNGFYEWALKSIDDRSLLPVWLRTHPFLAKMRKDPRYVIFLKGWKLPA